jgi:spermidine synthase
VSAGTMLSPVKPGAELAKAELPGKVASRGQSWFFAFFFLSGFCSILYELVWLRLAMAQFGVTTPMVSIVLSSFMAGLGLGSWWSGHLLRKHGQRFAMPHLQLYAITEMIIGGSAVIVPLELAAGRWILEHVGSGAALSSSGYYVASGFWLALTLVPWCSCMGATIPLGMSAIRNDPRMESRRSFSFLYLANVLGAVAGALIPLLLIEIWGFKGTLRCGMLLNLAIGSTAFVIGRKSPHANSEADPAATALAPNPQEALSTVQTRALTLRGLVSSGTLWLLFATGLTSMGMEVVWTRQFTIYLGTLVYSFAAILGCYLAATFIGSSIYRKWSRTHRTESPVLWMLVWLAALIPLVTADPWVPLPTWLRLPLGIMAFSGLLGFLTPQLVDQFSEGDPNRAGIGYAVNVAGCIIGPLLAGFLLLPNLDERHAFVVLALPWFCVGSWCVFLRQNKSEKRFDATVSLSACVILALSCCCIFLTRSYLSPVPGGQVRRDSTATVVATGQDMRKLLFVNGINMTGLTPVTKFMSALPLTHLDHTPQNALVICFGMGTTHRSMLSWGIDSTAVDLVPSVPQLFWYFHSDASQLLASPHSHVIIDDGRRFLERTVGEYDVIAIDPPPPIGAAGSSLLYSREFYSAAKKRLRPDGILQQWYPSGDAASTAAVARAIRESFPYVRVFISIEHRGLHYLASGQPIPQRTAAELAARMPSRAADDLVEWGPYHSAQEQFAAVLRNEVAIDSVIARDENVPPITDDRPINEYSLLRDLRSGGK